YGADIACGDIQPLGMHIQCGGGQAGFIAVHDEPKFVMEIPLRIYGIVPTLFPGEYGFGEIAIERTSLMSREKGKEWVGTMANLWGITAAVYLATLGRYGLVEIGKLIMSNTHYAYDSITNLPNVTPRFSNNFIFREFVVNYADTNKHVTEINRKLLEKKIFGGYDLTGKIKGLDDCVIYCTTEIHSKKDIDTLVNALKEIIG
ncbi:MAG: aminomethyl-transferring glycine dehydrogenase, partial [Candidatus Kryptoniota bacterium]